jgi:hypothetical protein
VKSKRRFCILVISGILAVLLSVTPSFARDLATKSCAELVRMAQSYQQDLKTVDTMLGSAIDAGTMDRVRTFKLRKSNVKQQLKSVLKVIQIKECTEPN